MATILRIFTKFSNYPLNHTGPNEMLFLQDRLAREPLVAGAHRRLLANATESSVCSGDAPFV